jgi:hypothetical protein
LHVPDKATGKTGKEPKSAGGWNEPPAAGWAAALHPDHIKRQFARPCNIGVLTGMASGGLIDVDLDTAAARTAAPYILPMTLRFGRHTTLAAVEPLLSEPRSTCTVTHYLYKVRDGHDTPTPSSKFHGVEIRGDTAAGKPLQTMFPGSTHPSGVPVQWLDENSNPVPAPVGEIKFIRHNALERRVSMLRLAALLGTLFTGAQGKFHNGMLCVAGGLYRAGYHIDEACSIVNAVCAISGQEGVDDRLKELNHTYSKGARNDPALASWGSLLQYFPDAKATVDALTFDWPEQRAPLREGADPELEAMTMGDTPGRKREEAAQAFGAAFNEAGVPQEDTAPAEVLAPGLFEGHGAVGLIGREKIGKSRLIRDLIRAALTGGTFYDEYTFARPCNVLFMALENTGQELHRFFNGSGIDLDLHCTRGASADEQREMLGVGRLDPAGRGGARRRPHRLRPQALNLPRRP